MRSRALRIAALLIACGTSALSAGCAAGPQEPGDVPTPAQFEDREVLPSCGEITLEQGEELPEDALACLGEAGEEGAELAVTRPTTEGDPITEYYRAIPGGGWEAYIDGTNDRHGGIWWYTPCPDAEALADLANCKGAPL